MQLVCKLPPARGPTHDATLTPRPQEGCKKDGVYSDGNTLRVIGAKSKDGAYLLSFA